MKYEIKIKASVQKTIDKIEKKFAKKIIERIDLLADEPRHNGSIKLSGEENAYRTRVGKYRIVYEIYDSEVLVYVINVDHRKDIYR
jgi:mRNA interferase RelE/StbE